MKKQKKKILKSYRPGVRVKVKCNSKIKIN